MAHDLCNTYTQNALDAIGELEDSDAKDTLLKMVCYLKVWNYIWQTMSISSACYHCNAQIYLYITMTFIETQLGNP